MNIKIKKRFYHYVLECSYSACGKKYVLHAHTKYVYRKDLGYEQGYYLKYHKATENYPEDFDDYVFGDDDINKFTEYSSDEYTLWSNKKLSNSELIDLFEMYMANRIRLFILHLQDNYSAIRTLLED